MGVLGIVESFLETTSFTSTIGVTNALFYISIVLENRSGVFTAFADLWPRATGNGDRRRPMRHWRGRNFDVDFHVLGKH